LETKSTSAYDEMPTDEALKHRLVVLTSLVTAIIGQVCLSRCKAGVSFAIVIVIGARLPKYNLVRLLVYLDYEGSNEL